MVGDVMVACDDGGGEGVGEGAAVADERFPAEEEEREEDVETDEGARENVTLAFVGVFVCMTGEWGVGVLLVVVLFFYDCIEWLLRFEWHSLHLLPFQCACSLYSPSFIMISP